MVESLFANVPVALFEWRDIKTSKPNLARTRNMGKALGFLHRLTENYSFPENEMWRVHLTNILVNLLSYKKFVEKMLQKG